MIPSRRRLHLLGAGLLVGLLASAVPGLVSGRIPSASAASLDVAGAAPGESSLEDRAEDQ